MKKIKRKNYGFTFIELIISITIVVILSAIGFSSYSEHLENSRDSERKSDLSGISSALKMHKTKRGTLPTPSSSFNLTNNGYIVATQGKLDENIVISTIDKIPKDPFINFPYSYSISKNKLEFQLASTLENNGDNSANVVGDYKTVSKNILPTLIIASKGLTNVEIKDGIGSGSINRTKFIFDYGSHNIPYSFSSPYDPVSDGTSFSGLLSDTDIKWWQNSDFRNCKEIVDSGKNIGTGEYQINNGLTLVNANCSNSTIPSSCKEIKIINPSAADGPYQIIPNGYTNPIFVNCDMTTDGGGYTFFQVTNGVRTYGSNDNNTCKTLGLDLVVPKTKNHFQKLITTYGATYLGITGIYKPTDGGSYTGVIMNSNYTTDRKAVDGGTWWLRDSIYSQPSGNYNANCRLGITSVADINNIQFDDINCGFSSINYICSTNDKNG